MAQNFFTSSVWSLVKEATPQETFELGAKPQYVYVDIHGAEIAELQERVKKIEERLEQKTEQEIFPIEFLESRKLTLKKPITIKSVYCLETETYVVDHFELNTYGEGRDMDEAIKDFKVALEETYFDLKEDKNKLSPPLQKEWELLNLVLKEK